MNYPVINGHIVRLYNRLLRHATSLALVTITVALALPARAADADGTGTVSGIITSTATGNALQGAAVSIPTLGRTVLSDETGHYLFMNLPAGRVEIVANYSGFAELRMPVIVTAGTTSQADFDLRPTDVLTMDTYTVATQREGQALSITEQRNALNPKTVVALDEWGVLPTQNVGELLSRMPGVSFSTDEDDLINNVNIRGMVSSNGQSFTRLYVDGMSSTGVGGNGRSATMHSFSAAMYEELEVIAGQTPDKRADSIGGQINLKTRSPLAMKEPSRFDYNLSGRYAPPTSKRNTDFGKHPYGYVATGSYTGVFDVFGGRKNLGINVNFAQQQITTQFDYDLSQYNNVADTSVAYFRDYDKASGVNHRYITGLGARADYRLSSTTTVSLRFIYNGGSEPFFHYTHINPFFNTNATLYDPNTTAGRAGGIMPGSTSTRTEIRPTGNAQMLLSPRVFSFTSVNPTETLVFEHNLGRLKIDHAWRMSHTHWDSNAGRHAEGGQLSMRTPAAPAATSTAPNNAIGFILDNSNLDGRVFWQTAGPSVYDPNSYTAFVVTAANNTTAPVDQTSVNLLKRSTITNTDEWSGTINATYTLPFQFSSVLKGGVDTVNRRVNNYQDNPQRWYLKNGVTLNNFGLMPITTFEENNGGRLPVFNPVALTPTLGDTNMWAKDEYYTASQRLTSSRHFKEMVDAAYLQAQMKFGRFSVLGGLREEKVKTNTWTYFRARTLTTAVEPDPYKRAAMEFNRQATNGSYSKLFPSVHGVFNVTPQVTARASWSTSYARPDMLQLIPGVTVSDTAQTVTIGNAALKPQQAKNVDLKLEYYSRSGGVFSTGVFQKNISDYLPSGLNYGSGDVVPNTPDNGFDGLYGGYTIIEPRNIGKLKVEGVEMDFRQNLRFLPGLLKGFTIRGNATIIRGEGHFSFNSAQPGFVTRYTSQIPGIVPRTFNAGVDYTYRKFSAGLDLNYSSIYVQSIAATPSSNPATFVQGYNYRLPLTRLGATVSYRLRPNMTVYLNGTNLTQSGPNAYSWDPSRKRNHYIVPMGFVAGIKGSF